ncbi:MAG: Fpg/Nei family DNA glycosylase [Candidatus Brocadiia bacterium]
MPELPDVESFARYVEFTSLHKPIESVRVRTREILEGVSPQRLGGALRGHRLCGTRRHGKFLFVRSDGGASLVLHFGMTGKPVSFKDPTGEPSHSRLLLRFADGYHLSFDCQRKLGLASLTKDEEGYLRSKEVGPDALEVSFQTFRDILAARRGMAKSTLMNQKVVAGLGNLVTDELLFQARLHPRETLDRVGSRKLRTLYEKMKAVLEALIDCIVHSRGLPGGYVLAHREPGGKCPRCGAGLQDIKFGGRTAYFCPRCQRQS